VLDDGQIENSLLSGGVRVSGNVRGSVLSPGVVVEAGATVLDSVLLPGVRVEAGATVRRSVVDDGVGIGRGCSVGGEGEITLLGLGAQLAEGTEVPAGARYPDETS
jgi:glucose-1-phosphate adenylyltransferase